MACRQLGFSGHGFRPRAYYGKSIGPIWLTNMECAGREDKLEDCQHPSWGAHPCTHSEDVSLICCEYFAFLIMSDRRKYICYKGKMYTLYDIFCFLFQYFFLHKIFVHVIVAGLF